MLVLFKKLAERGTERKREVETELWVYDWKVMDVRFVNVESYITIKQSLE